MQFLLLLIYANSAQTYSQSHLCFSTSPLNSFTSKLLSLLATAFTLSTVSYLLLYHSSKRILHSFKQAILETNQFLHSSLAIPLPTLALLPASFQSPSRDVSTELLIPLVSLFLLSQLLPLPPFL